MKPCKKRKLLMKRKDDSTKWMTCDINHDDLYMDDSAVEGFLGLEEMNEYTEEDFQKILGPVPKRKKKRKSTEIRIKEVDLEQGNNQTESDVADQRKRTEFEHNAASNDNESISNEAKSLTKKEKRREKRKRSYKNLLKERRKKHKELKKQRKREHNEEIEKDVESSKKVDGNEIKVASDKDKDCSDWKGLGVPELLLKALFDSGFTTPTPIQKESLIHAILYHQDILGAAETGSGKTLAFGIPILTHIMKLKQNSVKKKIDTKSELNEDDDRENDEDDNKPLYALILTPTRELAIQIQSHITNVGKYTDVKSVAIVGGLAAQKQERLLNKCPEIVIGTPGRLHKLMTNGDLHLNKLNTLKFVVIDECDRMLEKGHFKEVNEIIDTVNLKRKVKQQKFLFSATLTLPTYHKQRKKKHEKELKNESEMETLVNKIGLNPKAKVIDLTTKHVTASSLQQYKIMCTSEEKEIYLLYFLMCHPGRTIIFVNSISCTRRLTSLLTLLQREPLQLHAGKQQRQRLKYLDRFVKNKEGLLIATDVASRGLDIPEVKNIVHFQLPIDPKVYIHRSGRTARANEEGVSFILEGPEDFKNYKKISQVLKLTDDIPTLDIQHGFLEGIKERVKLAREIDKEEYHLRKDNADNSWVKRAAASMEIEIDSDESKVTKSQKIKLSQKRKILQRMLKTKLIPKGFSVSYPTRTGGLVAPALKPLV